jgi:hypothetical protein
VNFARVPGVILDACRAHGAWFDAGELRAVRTFVRGSGPGRFARRRQLDRERERRPPVPVGGAGGIDLIDELAGIPDRWGVPSRASTTRRFVRVAILATVGGAILWGAFSTGMARGSARLAGLGCLLLVAALRAVAAALAARPSDMTRARSCRRRSACHERSPHVAPIERLVKGPARPLPAREDATEPERGRGDPRRAALICPSSFSTEVRPE